MPHPLFVGDARVRIQAAIASAQHAAQISHRGLAGEVREILVRELLRPILPPTIAIGSGKVVDHLGVESRQIDVIIYDRSVMPSLLYGAEGTVGLVPIEACIYAVEVKTKSTVAQTRHAAEIARSVSQLTYLPEFCINGLPRDRVICAYFAFGSNRMTAAGDPELQRWRSGLTHWNLMGKVLPSGQVQRIAVAPVAVVSVLGQGYGYYDPHAGAAGSYGWIGATPAYDEILWFLVGVANTLGVIAGTRRGLPFGRYLT